MAPPRYTARFPFPEPLELGADAVVDCPVYRDGALVAPTQSGSTLTVTDPGGTVVVDAAAVTVTGSVATYTIPASILPATLAVEDGWLLVWSLVISGVTYKFRQDGSSVRCRLYPTITDADVVRRVRSLDPSLAAVITTRSTFQGDIDEADIEVQNRMFATGKRPHMVARPSALRAVWLAMTVAIVFEDLASRNADAYAQTAADWRKRAEDEWARAAPLFDTDGDGQADVGGQSGIGSAELWSC